MESIQDRNRVRLGFWLPLGTALMAALAMAQWEWWTAGGAAAATDTLATPLWMFLTPLTILTIAALGLWNESQGELSGAAALATLAGTMAVYQLLLTTDPAILGAFIHPVLDFMSRVGWMLVLAISQGCALVIYARCTGVRRIRLESFVVLALLFGVVASAVGGELTGVVILLWMASLAVVPIALWRSVAHFHERRRHAVILVALASVTPAAVVLVCGVLAVAVSYGTAARGAEIDLLGTGFLLGQLGSALLFTRSLRTLREEPFRPRTSAVTVLVRIILWTVYLLCVAQLGATVGAWWGGQVADVAVATTVLGAAGLPLWLTLVRWCEVLANPRRAAAVALLKAGGAQARDAPAELAQEVLRQALDDPSLFVAVALSNGDFFTLDGVAVAPPAGLVVKDSNGTALAAVVWKATAARAPSGLDTVVQVVRPLLERAALQAEILDQAARLASERGRADNAAVQERNRLERDLHDGVQGRILSLGMTLGLAQDQVADGETQMILGDAVAALRSVLAELRGLANGNVPHILSRDGLTSAVSDFVSGIPLPIAVSLPSHRMGAAVEAVAYFVIAEAVTNAVKHSGCSKMTVEGESFNGIFSLSIHDNGCGGADPRAGSGLRGLGERVHAVGGHLLISDGIPGTHVEVSLPCE